MCINDGPIYDGDQFRVARWRYLIEKVVERICPEGIKLFAICPFGFEILENREFIKRPLTRFYCYIGSTKNQSLNIETVEHDFLTELFNELCQIDPEQAKDVVVMAAHSGRHIKLRPDTYSCLRSDKLIVVEYRCIESTLLADYSDYLICCLNGFVTGTIPEWSRINNDPMARVRMFQIYIILDQLFGYLIEPYKPDELRSTHIFYSARSDLQFYFSGRRVIPPTLEETTAIELLQQRTKLMLEAVSKPLTEHDHLRSVESIAYHGNRRLTITMSNKAYIAASQKISDTYQAYAS